MISDKLEHALRALGESGEPGIPELLAERETAWRLLMCGHEPWQKLGSRLSSADLKNVIKGLVLYSQASKWSGGSVSPVIPLYREFLSRSPLDEPQLTSWIVDHRRNEYEPFGTFVHGDARTLADFHGHQQRRAQEHSEALAREEERQAESARHKAARATELVRNAVKRGDVLAVRALIAKGADLTRALPENESLVELAHVNGRGAMVQFLEELHQPPEIDDINPDSPSNTR